MDFSTFKMLRQQLFILLGESLFSQVLAFILIPIAIVGCLAWRFREQLVAIVSPKKRPPNPAVCSDLISRKREINLALQELRFAYHPPSATRLLPLRREVPASALILGSFAHNQALLTQSSLGLARRSAFAPDLHTPTQNPVAWACNDDFIALSFEHEKDPLAPPDATWTHAILRAKKTMKLGDFRFISLGIDLQILGSLSRPDFRIWAHALARKIFHTQTKLDVVVPVFLTIDGLSELPGFDAFCQILSRDEKSTSFGWEVSGQDVGHAQLRANVSALSDCMARLHDRVLQELLLQDDRALADDIKLFCESLQALSPRIIELVQELLAYQGQLRPIRIRGALFCDTQSSLFIEHLFSHMLHFSRHERRPMPKTRRQRSWQIARVGGLSLLLFWPAMWVPFMTYENNHKIQRRLTDIIHRLEPGINPPVPSEKWIKSAHLDHHLRDLVRTKALSHRFGMSQVEVMQQASRSLFLRLTLRGGVAPLFAQDQARLHAQVRYKSSVQPKQIQDMRQRLFRYLLLSKGPGSFNASRDEQLSQRLAVSLASQWTKEQLILNADDALFVAQHFVGYLRSHPELLQTRDTDLVSKIQTQLNDSSLLLQLATATLEEINRDLPPLDLQANLGPAFLGHRPAIIRASFTQDGWNEHVAPRLEALYKAANRDLWLLGPLKARDPNSSAKALAKFERNYTRAFVREWRNALDRIAPMDSPGTGDSLETALLDPKHNPFQRLSNLLQTHTNLSWPGPHPRGQLAPGETIASLRSKFSPLITFGQISHADPQTFPPDLSRYIRLISKLHQLRNDPAAKAPGALKQLSGEALQIASAQREDWRPWFSQVLARPFLRLRNARDAEQTRSLEQAWCELNRQLRADIFSKYPFRPRAIDQSELSKLSQLLHPQKGQLWQWVETDLQGQIRRRGTQFHTEPTQTPKNRIHRRFLAFLNAAWQLSTTLFAQGQSHPSLRFSVRAQSRGAEFDAAFELDEQRYHYAERPARSTTLQWPSEASFPRALVAARSTRGHVKIQENGTWALFQLLESGRAKPFGHSTGIQVTWPSHPSATSVLILDIRSLSGPSPFFARPNHGLMGLFRHRALQSPPPLFRHSIPCI